MGNERLFVDLNRDKLSHNGAWGWTAWNGSSWVKGADWLAMKAAKDTADKLLEIAHEQLDVASKIDGEAGRQFQRQAMSIYNHACKSRQEQRLHAILSLARSSLHEEANAFDFNPFDLNTPAGIVDLKTGIARKHDPKAKCTMITAVAPGIVPTPMFATLLHTIACEAEELIHYLQQIAGMAAIGKAFVEGLVICYGKGRNGKSTFLNLLARVLGDYACSISPEILMAQRFGQQPQGMAAVRGKRLVISQETEEGKRLSISAVKQLSSTDKIVAKRLYRDPEEFIPTHTLILATNFLPKVSSLDTGTWRRLIVVPFLNTIPDSEVQPDFLDMLYASEAPAVLQWIIDGAVRFVQNNYRLDVPEIVRNASEQYAIAENWLLNFIAECCETGPGYREQGGRLYEAYRAWAQSNGDIIRTSMDVAAALEMAGYTKIRTRKGSEWQAIRILPRIDLKKAYCDSS